MSDPRILVADIETVPAIVLAFSQKIGFIPIDNVVEPDRMVCYSAKWAGEDKVAFSSEYHHDREKMLYSLYSLLDEADAVVTYNGDNFDIPWWNRSFLEQGLGLPSPYVSIDIYKAFKKNTRFFSHKMQYLATSLQLEQRKLDPGGMLTWRKIMGLHGPEEQKKAWGLMRRYNKRDLAPTELLYYEARPLLNSKFNFGLFNDSNDLICPRCGSHRLQRRGVELTSVSSFQRYQCQECGSWTRGGKREKGVDLR